MISERARIGPRGRITLKKSVRDALHIEGGMFVEEEIVGNSIFIKPIYPKKVSAAKQRGTRLNSEK